MRTPRQTAARRESRHEVPMALSDITVEPVRSASQRDAFIRFQLDLYQRDPWFVPPIIAERRDFLDVDKNPFLQHAELQMFLAYRDGKCVGRIAAVNDPNYNHFHNSDTGFFGMFDVIDDPAVAKVLLESAADWCRRRGMKTLIGPVNLSTNHDCGVLVDGFNASPAMMMPYNFAYYAKLLEVNGFRSAKELWTYDLSTSTAPPETVVRIAERVRSEPGVRVRPLRMGELPEEIRRIKQIYNAMLERNWGFVPMSEEEFDLIAARLTPLVRIRPELCLIAEVNDEPVAFSLTLPDSNVAIKAAGGSLTRFGLPLGLARLFWATRSIHRLRVLMLGIKPGYRRRGLDALLYLETLRAARALGYSGGELGWTTEDNDLMNRAIERMGGRRYKTYRLYQRSL